MLGEPHSAAFERCSRRGRGDSSAERCLVNKKKGRETCRSVIAVACRSVIAVATDALSLSRRMRQAILVTGEGSDRNANRPKIPYICLQQSIACARLLVSSF